MKNLPGRRTDGHECQGLPFLHSGGRLPAAFGPEGDGCAVGWWMGHRDERVKLTRPQVQHRHQWLTQMKVQIHPVISDITGLSGLAMVDAMNDGERDPEALAQLREPPIQARPETIRKWLEGNWRPEHRLTLEQSRQSYGHYQEPIAACDEKIEKRRVAFQPRLDPAEQPLPPDRKRKQRGRKKKHLNPQTGLEVRTESYPLFGVELRQGPGLMAMVLTRLSEVGRDMSRGPTAAPFVSWLGLCPDHDISRGRLRWRGVRQGHNRAGQLFRRAAHSRPHEHTPLGDYRRRMKAQLGPAAATTATAHKIALLFYTMVKKPVE